MKEYDASLEDGSDDEGDEKAEGEAGDEDAQSGVYVGEEHSGDGAKDGDTAKDDDTGSGDDGARQVRVKRAVVEDDDAKD